MQDQKAEKPSDDEAQILESGVSWEATCKHLQLDGAMVRRVRWADGHFARFSPACDDYTAGLEDELYWALRDGLPCDLGEPLVPLDLEMLVSHDWELWALPGSEAAQ